MTNRQIRIATIYMLMVGLCTFSLGRTVGVEQQLKKYEELKAINNNLYNVIQKQTNSYSELAEYKWQLESCYQQIGDMQDDYDVNNDGVVDALDYIAIKKYLMSQS